MKTCASHKTTLSFLGLREVSFEDKWQSLPLFWTERLVHDKVERMTTSNLLFVIGDPNSTKEQFNILDSKHAPLAWTLRYPPIPYLKLGCDKELISFQARIGLSFGDSYLHCY